MKYAGFALAATLAACSLYDEPWWGPTPEADAGSSGSGTAGGSGSGGAGRAAGTGGAAGSTHAGSSGAGRAGSEAGTGGGAGSAGTPSPSQCGNGRVDPGERCDTTIAAGMSGACPTSCAAANVCSRGTIHGSGCTTECLFDELGCANGDGCCPLACSASQDDDCAGRCGDGLVQTERDETCEPGNGATRCPTASECADDDACTTDGMSGSPASCNAVCTHTAITAAVGGDGCCPPGANAASDSDCQPHCGNGVREGSEACDGTTGCGPACSVILSESQIMCLDTVAETACERCECTLCTNAMLGCQSSGNASRDQACTAVASCALEHDCAGMACYCGTASTTFACAWNANGACRRVIEQAAGTTSPNRILSMVNDSNSVLGRALALGDCRRAQCSSDCR